MQSSKSLHTTLADVAQQAGVSRTTAARVIHNNGYVSEDSRAAVLAAAKALGYRPNLQARALKTKRSKTIGLVFSDIGNPLFTKLSHAIRTEAMKAGFSVLTVNHEHSTAIEKAGVDQLLDYRVDVVVVYHARDHANYLPLQAAGVPLIQIERRAVRDTHFVAYDAEVGMRMALDELMRAGHRRIGYIGGREPNPRQMSVPTSIEPERAKLFRRLLHQSGIPVRDCPVHLWDYLKPGPSGRIPGYDVARRLLDTALGQRMTALFVASDMMAAGVLQALYERDLRVPDNISVIGYDDAIAELMSPPLSSILQPFSAIAKAVIDIVVNIRSSGPLLERTVATSLVKRGSVGPVDPGR